MSSGRAQLAVLLLAALPATAAEDLRALEVRGLRGQSAELARRDRYECHNWAVAQTHYNPSDPHLAPHQQIQVVAVADPPPPHDTVVGAMAGAMIGAAIGSPHDAAQGAVVGAIAGGAMGAASDSARQKQAQQSSAQGTAAHLGGRRGVLRGRCDVRHRDAAVRDG